MHKAFENNFYPDSSRTIKVFGFLDNGLVNRVALKAALLEGQSSQPITLQIKSRGGHIKALKRLEHLLSQKNHDPRRAGFVTLASGTVRSAAAYLLVLGQHAFSAAGLRLVFHGVRVFQDEDGRINKRKRFLASSEAALGAALQLETENHRMAENMAQAMIYRLIHRFLCYQNWMERQGRQVSREVSRQIDAFAMYTDRRLRSTPSKAVLEDALAFTQLALETKTCFQRMGNPPTVETTAVMHGQIIELVVSRVLGKQPEAVADFMHGAALQVIMGYLFVRDLIAGKHEAKLQDLLKIFGLPLLTSREKAHYLQQRNQSARAAKSYIEQMAMPRLRSLWYLAMAICRRLLRGETVLYSAAAYHLGLIDAVHERKSSGKPLTWTPLTNEYRKSLYTC